MTLPYHRSGRTQTNIRSAYDGWLYPQSGTPSIVEHQDVISSFSDRSFEGTNTPNYNRLKAKGELIPMTHWYQREISGFSTGSYNLKYAGSSRYASAGNASLYSDWWAFAEEDANSYANNLNDYYVQAAAAKLYGRGHDTATFLSEMSEVISTFIQTASRLASLITSPVKFIKRTRVKDVANDWLAARYGWRPLLHDIDNLSKVIAEYNNSKARKVWKEHAGVTYSDSDVEVSYINHANIYIMRRTKTTSATIRHGGSVVAQIQLPQFQFNLFQTGWEVIPYSFVVDWVLGVGQAIAAASLSTFSQKLTAAAGYVIELSQDIDYEIDHFLVGNLSGFRVQNSHVDVKITRRRPCKVPLLPQLKMNINVAKIFDLLSMIIQRR